MRSKSTPNPDSLVFDFSEPTPTWREKLAHFGNDFARKYPKEHGWRSKLNNIFHCMHHRCLNPKHEAYERYAGRGITICPEWLNNYAAFLEWALSSGYTEGLTLDRADNEKGYSPDNCRWQTVSQQSNNRRNNHCVTAWGETKTITEWARDPRCVVAKGALRLRLISGQSPEVAITKSVRVTKPRTYQPKCAKP